MKKLKRSDIVWRLFHAKYASAQKTSWGLGSIAMTFMRVRTDKSLYLLPLFAGIAVLLFGTAGIARIMGWAPNSTDAFVEILAIEPLMAASAKPVSTQVNFTPPQVEGNAPAKRRCAECGVIASMREIEVSDEMASLGEADTAVGGNANVMKVKSAKSYEIGRAHV